MIKLFRTPQDIIDLSSFDHILHGSVVTLFEEQFSEYVGAKYACSFNSATSALYLILKLFPDNKTNTINVPSIIPPVVLNAIITSGHQIKLIDEVSWVGHSYVLHTYSNGWRIIDSAQRVDRNQFLMEAQDNDLMVFSFYPTKPVSSCDGGMVVSNNKDKIEILRAASMNGMGFSINSWERIPIFPGYKMYMNSIQAKIALKGLLTLDNRKLHLSALRDFYNDQLELNNTSSHLYRIGVIDNMGFIKYMKNKGIQCGKHYAATHMFSPYKELNKGDDSSMMLSEYVGKTTVSIPFHEGLILKDTKKVVEAVHEYKKTANFQG